MSTTIEAITAAVKVVGTQEKLIKGSKRPSPYSAKRIEAVTNGKVTKETIRPDIFL